MSRLTCIAIHQTRLEKAFLQDNVQGYRVELNRALQVLEATYPEEPLVDHEVMTTRLDGPEKWL